MNIIESNLKFKNLSSLGSVKRIIIHNADASICSIEDIHQWHLNNGWSGCGYHFLVRKDGSIYRGRPENCLGSHTASNNTGSLGICFEGKYNTETMPEAQLKAGQELIVYLCDKYKISKKEVYKHKDFNSTDCPGNNFPWDKLIGSTIVNVTVTTTPAKYNWISRLQEECNKQEFSNQKVDGIAGSNTLKGCPTLRKGASGNITKILQERLVNLGYSTNGIDGIFGTGTHNAVKKYQAAKKINADGVVGQNTWRKLLDL